MSIPHHKNIGSVARRKLERAFTLLETMVAVAVIVLLYSMFMQAVATSQVESAQTVASGHAANLNEAIARAKLDGKTDPSLSGNDATAAAQYLINNGYLQ